MHVFPGFSQNLETTLSLHPPSLVYSLAVTHGHWVSLTLEQQISKSVSIIVTPTTYSHKYSTHSEGWFDTELDVTHSHQASALYIGPRFFTEYEGAFPLAQVLVKYTSALSKEGGDGYGTYKHRSLGALFYLGLKRKGKLMSSEINVGYGREFHEIEHFQSMEGMTGLFPEDVLFDVNFCIGFHT